MITEGIILAAGLSSRVKTNKLLLELSGKTVIENCVESFYDVCTLIIVVGGYCFEELKPVLSKYGKLKLVFNKNHPDGMFSSVKVGIEHVTGDRFFITPGDYPIIRKTTVYKMLESDKKIVVPEYKGQPGHPVLIKSSLISYIKCGSYQSLNDFICLNDPELIQTDDSGVISDIDYIDDYERIKRMISV